MTNAAGGTPGNVDLAVGRLWVAPLGTSEPASASAAIPSAWRPVGYTEDGSVFTSESTSEKVNVAEELRPIRSVQTAIAEAIQFSMAEVTRRNLALGLAAAANADNDAQAIGPTAVGSQVAVAIMWEKNDPVGGNYDDTNIRHIFRQCKQVAAVEIAHRKAPQKALIPVRFEIELPDAGGDPWVIFPNASGLIA